MLHNTTQLYGRSLGALDGFIRSTMRAFFDDQTWVVRYLVASLGSRLIERLVLQPRCRVRMVLAGA